jgi:hypothetical protein
MARVKAGGLTAEQVASRDAAEEQERVNSESRAALAATDWQVIRAMERWMVEHNELPTEFGQDREALRQAVDDSRA